jgi:hypothetical protein
VPSFPMFTRLFGGGDETWSTFQAAYNGCNFTLRFPRKGRDQRVTSRINSSDGRCYQD